MSGKPRQKGEAMISPTAKHQLITDLDEARYLLSHLVIVTVDEILVKEELDTLLRHVSNLRVEGE